MRGTPTDMKGPGARHADRAIEDNHAQRTEIRKLGRGSLRGFATASVGGFIRLSHIKIIQPEGKEPFIQMPQRSCQMNDGGRRCSNPRTGTIVGLPDAVLDIRIGNIRELVLFGDDTLDL
jgi:hypothetical protein